MPTRSSVRGEEDSAEGKETFNSNQFVFKRIACTLRYKFWRGEVIIIQFRNSYLPGFFQRWMPILKKHQVELPLECPFHESRDIFRPQQKAKHQHRPSQWTCGLCGKSFYAEKHLDAHFDNRHKSNVNTVIFRLFSYLRFIQKSVSFY